MADALSRNTLPIEKDNIGVSIASVLISLDPQLDKMREAAKKDPSYQRLLTFVKGDAIGDL